MKNILRNIFKTLLLICCFVVPVGGWLYFNHFMPEWFPNIQERGLYGDQFGALNTLFSGLAFGGVVLTLYLNVHQLRLQQRESEAQTKSLQQSQKELSQQTQLLSEQVTTILPAIHRVSDAEDRLECAELLLSKANDRVGIALNMIDESGKRESAFKAFSDSNASWQKYVGDCINFQAGAAPVPSGSTATLASAISLQVRFTEERARQVADWASWLLANYGR